MSPHDLDRQLQAALEAQAAPEQVARLAAYWQRLSRAELRRRRLGRAVAVAATVGAVATAIHWFAPQRPALNVIAKVEQFEEPAVAPAPFQTAPRQDTGHNLVVENPAADPRDSRSAGRPATGYERAMFAVLTRTSLDANTADLADDVNQTIDQLAADPSLDAAHAAQSADFARRGAEALLLKRLPRAPQNHRRAIVQLLAASGTPRSLPALLRAAQRPQLREEALAAVEQIVGLDSLAGAVQLTPDRSVRAALLQRLLSADSTPALKGYLLLVSQDALRGEALTAAVQVEQLPVDALIAQLADDEKSIRLSAALVLGHVDGPRIAQSLIALISRDQQAPAEAWVALLACRDGAADRFLAQAAYQPRWLAQVNNARVFWARFTP